jgi:hypothetical protein
MDFLTIALATAVVVVIAARLIELAVKRPDAFADMLEGAQRFAERARTENATEVMKVGRRASASQPRHIDDRKQPAHAA